MGVVIYLYIDFVVEGLESKRELERGVGVFIFFIYTTNGRDSKSVNESF